MKKELPKVKIIRDTREQTGWVFEKSDWCDGTVTKTLPSADYSIEGLEDKFVIERKGKLQEFAKNILEDRFERELERLDQFDHSFIIGEFTIEDIYMFPVNSGIPKFLWGKLRVKPELIIKRYMEIQTNHKVKIIPAGRHARSCAETLFKRFQCLIS